MRRQTTCCLLAGLAAALPAATPRAATPSTGAPGAGTPSPGEPPKDTSSLAQPSAAAPGHAVPGVIGSRAAPPGAANRQVALTPPATSVQFTTYAMGLFPLTGHFDRFAGELDVDPTNPNTCAVSLDISVASLQMADPSRAKDAVGPSLLDAAAYPHLTYQGSCAGGHASGMLTMHGVTRPLELTATRQGDTVTAQGTLHRQEYGVTGLPGLLGRTIRITFAVSLPDGLAKLMAH